MGNDNGNGMNGITIKLFLANGTEWRLWISGNFSPEPWLAQVLSKKYGKQTGVICI